MVTHSKSITKNQTLNPRNNLTRDHPFKLRLNLFFKFQDCLSKTELETNNLPETLRTSGSTQYEQESNPEPQEQFDKRASPQTDSRNSQREPKSVLVEGISSSGNNIYPSVVSLFVFSIIMMITL